MWFTFVTARLFIFLSFQPRLAATLLRSCSVVNSPTRRVGLAPTFMSASLAQALFPPVKSVRSATRHLFVVLIRPLRLQIAEQVYNSLRLQSIQQSLRHQ